MAAGDRGKRAGPYLAVDVGGTKIQASLVEEAGTILGRWRPPRRSSLPG